MTQVAEAERCQTFQRLDYERSGAGSFDVCAFLAETTISLRPFQYTCRKIARNGSDEGQGRASEKTFALFLSIAVGIWLPLGRNIFQPEHG